MAYFNHDPEQDYQADNANQQDYSEDYDNTDWQDDDWEDDLDVESKEERRERRRGKCAWLRALVISLALSSEPSAF